MSYWIGICWCKTCKQIVDVMENTLNVVSVEENMNSQDLPTLKKDTRLNTKPIYLDMEFVIEDDGTTLFYNGHAFPEVSSGCSFGGGIHIQNNAKETIKEIIENQKDWLWRSYSRIVKEKNITIKDKTKKVEQERLF